MSIAVEDWDDLTDARQRRDKRARVTERASVTERAPGAVESPDETPSAPQREPESTLGVANFADDSYGDTTQDVRLPAGVAGANLLFWLVGRAFGVVELVGVAFFVSVGLLLAAYVLREWQRDRSALICLAGAVPLPVTIIGLFT